MSVEQQPEIDNAEDNESIDLTDLNRLITQVNDEKELNEDQFRKAYDDARELIRGLPQKLEEARGKRMARVLEELAKTQGPIIT